MKDLKNVPLVPLSSIGSIPRYYKYNRENTSYIVLNDEKGKMSKRTRKKHRREECLFLIKKKN